MNIVRLIDTSHSWAYLMADWTKNYYIAYLTSKMAEEQKNNPHLNIYMFRPVNTKK